MTPWILDVVTAVASFIAMIAALMTWRPWREIDLSRIRIIPPPKVGRWVIIASTPTTPEGWDVGRHRTYWSANRVATWLQSREPNNRTRYSVERVDQGRRDSATNPPVGGAA